MSIKNVLKNYKLLFKDALNDLKTKGKRHKQIPNILTLTRLIAAPLFIIPTAIAGNVPFIVIFTLLFSLTDAVDGFIARRYNLISELGKDLDAICDKFFAGTLLIAASCFSPILLFNLVGELVIAIINIKHKLDGKQPRSLYVGKIKTCVLYPLLGIGILNNFVNVESLFHVLLAATTSMQMLTITSYLLKYEVSAKKVENNNYDKIELSIEEKDESEKDNVKTKQKEILAEYDELRHLLEQESPTYIMEKPKVKTRK